MEKNSYVGKWISLEELDRDIVVGDLIMLETSEETIVVEVSKITQDTELWHSNNWIIPRRQIVAIKESDV